MRNRGSRRHGNGITETSTMVTMNWPVGGRALGSCGLPLPGLAARIVDPATGRDVDPLREGELIVRGPDVMLGYHDKLRETRAALHDGWYHAGDLAKSDENGLLTIAGRLKECIIRGGQNIAPAKIEEVVNTLGAALFVVSRQAKPSRPRHSLLIAGRICWRTRSTHRLPSPRNPTPGIGQERSV